MEKKNGGNKVKKKTAPVSEISQLSGPRQWKASRSGVWVAEGETMHGREGSATAGRGTTRENGGEAWGREER